MPSKRTSKPDAPERSSHTTIRVGPEFAKHASNMAKMKCVSIADLLDEMFTAVLKEELIRVHESKANELRGLPLG